MQALLAAIAQAPRGLEAERVFHGRGGMYPGCEHLTLDLFPPVWLLTSFEVLSANELATLHDALHTRWQQIATSGEPLNWVYQCRANGHTETRLMAGEVPKPHLVHEQGSQYAVHLLRGQNHGLFLDMGAGRAWVRAYAAQHPGLQVLNLFAYTCAFSVVALQGGAGQVLNVDMSDGAIAIGQHNHALNGLQGRARFMAHDIFKSWGKINRAGPYGLIIIDPPSYQKGSFVASQDYSKLMRRLPDLLLPGGRVMLCLNAPELDVSFLQERMHESAPALVFLERLANPIGFPDSHPERALKVLIYELPNQPPSD